MTMFLRCLPIVLLASAAFLGMYMVVSGRKKSGGKESGRAEDADGTPVSAGTAVSFIEPAPEDLEPVEACAESVQVGAYDEGPTDLEKAVVESGDSASLRLTLIGLLRSWMTITDPSGRPVTEERLLAGAGERPGDRPEHEDSLRKNIGNPGAGPGKETGRAGHGM